MSGEVTLATLCMLHARGSERWPEVDLDLATFQALARLVDGPFDDIRADELYLAMACAAGNEEAVAALDRHYISGLVRCLLTRGYDEATAADVVQTVRVRFLLGEAGQRPRIVKYNGRGSLATWLRVAAVRLAISAQRKQHRETAMEIDVAVAEENPELALLQHRLSADFKLAFRDAFEALTPRERNLVRYQVIDQLGIDRIAAIYGIHRATAARWIAHAREALIDGVRRELDALLIPGEELDSLLRMVHSNLELSLRLFATPTFEQRADAPARARSPWR